MARKTRVWFMEVGCIRDAGRGSRWRTSFVLYCDKGPRQHRIRYDRDGARRYARDRGSIAEFIPIPDPRAQLGGRQLP